MYKPLSLTLAIISASVPLLAQETKSLDALEEQAFKQAAALVDPSIVRIETVGGLDRVGQVLVGDGPTTGVIVSEDGYIISVRSTSPRSLHRSSSSWPMTGPTPPRWSRRMRPKCSRS